MTVTSSGMAYHSKALYLAGLLLLMGGTLLSHEGAKFAFPLLNFPLPGRLLKHAGRGHWRGIISYNFINPISYNFINPIPQYIVLTPCKL